MKFSLYLISQLLALPLLGCQSQAAGGNAAPSRPIVHANSESRLLQFPVTDFNTGKHATAQAPRNVRGPDSQARENSKENNKTEFLFFRASKRWDELRNWQAHDCQSPGTGTTTNTTMSVPNTAQFGADALQDLQQMPQNIAMRAYRSQRSGRKPSPSIQFVVYDEAYQVQPREYLANLRASWQNSVQIREVRAPEVHSFGHNDNYGYLLYFMSKKYLYTEFILFIQHRAVHFVFQSPHSELKSAAAAKDFYLQVHDELERGLYFRKRPKIKIKAP